MYVKYILGTDKRDNGPDWTEVLQSDLHCGLALGLRLDEPLGAYVSIGVRHVRRGRACVPGHETSKWVMFVLEVYKIFKMMLLS